MSKQLAFSYILNALMFFAIVVLSYKIGIVDKFKDQYFYTYIESSYADNSHYIEYKPIYESLNSEFSQNKIVFIGDSITYRFPWHEAFSGQAINRGIGSDTTFGILNRLDDIAKLNPKIVLVMAGINDLSMIDKSRERERVKEVLENYKKIIIFFKNNGTPIIVQSVLYTKNGDSVNILVKEFNANLKSECASMGVTFLDLNQILFGNNKPVQYELFLQDGVHLNNNAYLLWVSAIKSKLKELKL